MIKQLPQRPALLDDLAELPTRNISRMRDGGSFTGEIYIGDEWHRLEHNQRETWVAGKWLATVETKISICEPPPVAICDTP